MSIGMHRPYNGAYSRILIGVSANWEVRRFLARLQYGHQDLEKIVILLSMIALLRPISASSVLLNRESYLDDILGGHCS